MKIQVNATSVINAASNISKQEVNGRPHYVVKDVTAVIADGVMNGILYPREELDKTYTGLNDKKMPYNHPKIGGDYVSAENILAVNAYYIGASATNAHVNGDRYQVDMYLDQDFASRTDGGKDIISRLDALMANSAAEPIQVSTGLLLNLMDEEGTSKGKSYTQRGMNFEWDHIAILPADVPAAGSPEEGVGIFASNNQKLSRFVVNLEEESAPDNSADKRDHSIIKRITNFITGNSSKLTFDQITDQIRSKLKENMPADTWPYIMAVYDNQFGYELLGVTYGQQYHIDIDNVVQFDGERFKATITTELEPVKSQEATQMNEEQMLAILANALKPVTDQLSAVNSELVAVKAQNADLKSSLEANSKKEEQTMRDAIKTKLGFTDAVVNFLSGDALVEVFAKTQASNGLLSGDAGDKPTKDGWEGYDMNVNFEETK